MHNSWRTLEGKKANEKKDTSKRDGGNILEKRMYRGEDGRRWWARKNFLGVARGNTLEWGSRRGRVPEFHYGRAIVLNYSFAHVAQWGLKGVETRRIRYRLGATTLGHGSIVCHCQRVINLRQASLLLCDASTNPFANPFSSLPFSYVLLKLLESYSRSTICAHLKVEGEKTHCESVYLCYIFINHSCNSVCALNLLFLLFLKFLFRKYKWSYLHSHTQS